MYRRFRPPVVHRKRPAIPSAARSWSFGFGLLVALVLVLAPVVGRIAIPSKFYKRPLDSNRRDAWFRPPSLFRSDAADSSLAGLVTRPTAGGRIDESSERPDKYDWGKWSDLPLKGAILGTDHEGRNVLWRLIHGSEVVIIYGALSAVLGVAAGLLWGLAMSWWTPPLFPGNHRTLAGWRLGAGWVANRTFELLDLFPRVILLLFISTVGGITLERFCLGVGLLIALQMASGVRQHTNELRRSDPVASAEELGLSPARIVWGHIVWNHLQGFVLSQLAFAVGAFVLWNGTLGYLGYAMPGHNNWGQLINEGFNRIVPWMTWAGSVATVMVALGLFRLSDGIERWRGAE